MPLTRAATFYYNKIPQPCRVIGVLDKNILAFNLLTGKVFIADPQKIDVRHRYSRVMMAYIRSCKKPPTRKQIMEKLGFNKVTVSRAFKAAEPEIKIIYGKNNC